MRYSLLKISDHFSIPISMHNLEFAHEINYVSVPSARSSRLHMGPGNWNQTQDPSQAGSKLSSAYSTLGFPHRSLNYCCSIVTVERLSALLQGHLSSSYHRKEEHNVLNMVHTANVIKCTWSRWPGVNCGLDNGDMDCVWDRKADKSCTTWTPSRTSYWNHRLRSLFILGDMKWHIYFCRHSRDSVL